MSLLVTASNWTMDDVPTKKRSSAIRKTYKVRPYAQQHGIENDEYNNNNNRNSSRDPEEFQTQGLNEMNSKNETRNVRVNELLNQMTAFNEENDGNKLADFIPMGNPSMMTTKTDTPVISKVEQMTLLSNLNTDGIPNVQFGPTNAGSQYSNYRESYEPAKYVAKATEGYASHSDDKLLEKINYMIHLLEEQQTEKTSNITEEFILYTFLGVFVIFVVDSFARVGKYVR